MVSACHVKEKGVIDGIKRPRNFGRALCVAVVLHGVALMFVKQNRKKEEGVSNMGGGRGMPLYSLAYPRFERKNKHVYRDLYVYMDAFTWYCAMARRPSKTAAHEGTKPIKAETIHSRPSREAMTPVSRPFPAS